MARNLLSELARLCGMETSYEDAWGRRRRLPRVSIEALLDALCTPSRDEPEIRAAIGRLKARRWDRALPRVHVVREGEPVEIPIAAPHAARDVDLLWHLEEECGATHRGSVKLATLPQHASGRVAGRRFECRGLVLPLDLPTGYHALHVESDPPDLIARCTGQLIVAPTRCYLPPALKDGRRIWGFALQLYALRSERNWGIGDFTDLADLVELAQGLGADLIGVNPLHACFLSEPGRESPYAACSRRFLNVLYLDVEQAAEFAECNAARERVADPEFQTRLHTLRAKQLVDYPGVARCKLEILELLYRSFREVHLNRGGNTAHSPRGEAFLHFQRQGGNALRDFATFEALSEHFAQQGGGHRPWEEWPLPFRDPESYEVQAFRQEADERITYFTYLQWLAVLQLGAVRARCETLTMTIGLYLDLAVGAARDGADVWGDREAYVAEATVGAPPDLWNPGGQDWGLPPLHPEVLQHQAYKPLVDVLRANMRHAGALRIDHVLALMHLYWIPEGHGAADGGYVGYPMDDLLGIVALESHRSRCIVIGEDLGTVPEHFKRRLEANGILSYKLLYFEQDDDGSFRPAEEYPGLALATVTTHDLPTLPGYWVAYDLSLRSCLGLFPSQKHEHRAFTERARDRRALLARLTADGLWSNACESDEANQALVEAVYAFLARTPCMILAIQIEDAIGQLEQPNLPGTTGEHPNWQRKLPSTLGHLFADPRLLSVIERVRRTRGTRVGNL